MNFINDVNTWWLFGLAFLGQIIYLLLKFDELNKALDNFDSGKWFRKERFGLIANIIIIFLVAALHDEWANEKVIGGTWVKVVAVFFGYTAQSSFKKVFGFIGSIFNKKTTDA